MAKKPALKSAAKPETPPFLIGIGSSAGGLEAIRELATNLPTDTGCAYVIVQHMSPQHKSLMTALIASETELAVHDVVDGQVPQANEIYVTPPRHDVLLEDGKLRLVEPSQHPGKPKPSVDRFLKSLAAERGEMCMALILSGTGSDGAYGVQAVREVGGITIAQDDASAKYDGMSNAAIETGCVDLVLRPSQIGTHLKKIMLSRDNFDQFRENSDEITPLSGILQIVLARTRVDFREYKQTTVQRRIERRMVALGIMASEDYVSYCRNNPREVDALFKDLLISVTRFFRDTQEFKELRVRIEEIAAGRGETPLRIWVAGCATGEEVYSIAILLAEAMGGPAELVKSRTQIFATDIDRAALDSARQGEYSLGALDDVPPEFIDTYFVQQTDGVRVVEALRSVILFSDHNLCQDPPFLNMDLICCRNLLIYFGAKLQTKVLSRLHYAMKQKAVLFLGTAESVSGAEQLFVPIGSNAHLFRKRVLQRKDHYDARTFSGSWSSRNVAIPKPAAPEKTSNDRLMFDALARSLGGNSVLVSPDHAFLRVYGDISAYVDLSETSSLNLQLSLLKSPYREEARSLVTLALKHKERRRGARHSEGASGFVRLEAVPILADDINEQLALLVITNWDESEEDAPQPVGFGAPGKEISGDHLRELDLELATTREALQQTIEELETSNEELQALNEELQSTNEELQATNEELETSNEELQSTNEELITVNEELQVNASELMALNAELGSVLGNVPVPLLVLDNALQVSRASIAAMNLFKIPSPPQNPHISQINVPNGFPRLVEICNQALQYGEPTVINFDAEGMSYSLQCAPFSGDQGQLIGATMVFIESPMAMALSSEMNEVLEHAPMHLLRYSPSGEIIRISSETAGVLGVTPQEASTKNIVELLEDGTDLNTDEVIPDLLSKSPGQLVLPFRSKEGGAPHWVSAERFIHIDPVTRDESIVIIGNDVTDIVEAKRLVSIQNESLQLIQEIAHIGHWRIDLKDQTLHWSDAVYDIHGVDKDNYTLELATAIDAYHPDDRAYIEKVVAEAIEQRKGFQFRRRLIQASGRAIWVESRGEVLSDDDGNPSAVVGMFRDVTDDMATKRIFGEISALRTNSDVGFFSFDVLTQSAFWSDNIRRLVGLKKTAPAGFEAVRDIVHPDDAKRFAKRRSDALEKGTPFTDTFKLKPKGKTPRRLEMEMAVTTDSDGRTINYCGTLHVLSGKDAS